MLFVLLAKSGDHFTHRNKLNPAAAENRYVDAFCKYEEISHHSRPTILDARPIIAIVTEYDGSPWCPRRRLLFRPLGEVPLDEDAGALLFAGFGARAVL